MREEVERPERLVDINALPLGGVRVEGGDLVIGALARMAEVAADPDVLRLQPLIAESLIEGASPQLRNMASIGGNLLQRVRCPYFRMLDAACNKRTPGAGCAAIDGLNAGHAILGTSDHCVATHPSDLAVALVALDATMRVRGPQGERSFPVEELFRLPGDTPHLEHTLLPGELIVEVRVPGGAHGRRARYLKVRDRASYEFALVSAAAALDDRGRRDPRRRGSPPAASARGPGACAPARRRWSDESRSGGRSRRPPSWRRKARAPLRHNHYKVELLPRTDRPRARDGGRGRMTASVIGRPLPRVDGRAKVTGGARYAADFNQEGQLYAVIVSATVGLGRVTAIDSGEVEGMPGVVAVITHRNAPSLPYGPHKGYIDPAVGERLHVLQDDRVRFYGQPVAIVVADTLDHAERAAAALRVTYEAEPPIVDPSDPKAEAIVPEAHVEADKGARRRRRRAGAALP